MAFVTDKQTLTDLNLLGKFKAGSMLNLFNRVKTRGGELLLEEMFRMPLADAAAINERMSRIQYVQQINLKLEISREFTEQASQYLTEPRPATRISSWFTAIKERTQEIMYRSEKFVIHQRHVHAVQEVLRSASHTIGQLQKAHTTDNPCHDIQTKIEGIVNAPDLKNLQAKFPYTVSQFAQCQFLFLNKYRQNLEELLRLMYELDVYISVAQVAKSKKLIYPEVIEESTQHLLEVENLRHLAVNNATGNSLQLTKAGNVLFLTGANMAGKSTWMKTLGTSFYLAHMGFPVSADRMKFSVMDGIFTSINVPDDISQGWSHFYAEVMRVKLVAREVSSGKRLFVLFDELFKGTNVKDAFDATLAVTQRLAVYRRCAFVISTHIIEVGESLMNIPNIQFGYMPTVMDGAVPKYTYQMTQGITTDRQGMIILENEGILDLLK